MVRRRNVSSLEIKFLCKSHGVHRDNIVTLVSTTATGSLHSTAISSGLSRDEKSISGCWTFITQSDISFRRTRELPGSQKCLMEKPLNLLHPLANYKRCSRNYARAWEICCPSVWPHKPHSKSQWCQKRFLYLRRREEPLRPPVYWPCVISVHQESCLQRWTLLRTVLWMVKIKRIIWVRCAEASMPHLNVSIKGIPGANAKLNEVEKDV